MSHAKKKEIFSHIMSYSATQYFSQGVGFFIATFIRRFLGPLNVGIWDILRVVVDYSNYAHLGVLHNIDYKIPYHHGKQDYLEVESVKNTVFTFTMLMTLVASIGISAYAMIFRASLRPEIVTGLFVVSVLIILQRLYTFFVMLLRAHKDFSILNKSVVFDAIVNFLFVVFCVRIFKLNGLYLTLLCMPVLNLIFILMMKSYSVRISLQWHKLAGYIRFGFPVFIVLLLSVMMYSIDKIMITKYLGLEALGFYSLGLMARSYGSGILKNFTIVILPHFLEDYGKANHDLSVAARYLKQPVKIMGIFMVLLLGGIYLAAPLFIQIMLPQFGPGLWAMRILLISTFFYTLYPEYSGFLIVHNKQKVLVFIVGLMILLNITVSYWLLHRGWGICGVAISTSLVSALIFVSFALYALSYIQGFVKNCLFLIGIIWPLLYGIALLLLLEHLPFCGNIWIRVFSQMILYGIGMLPVIYYLDRMTGIIRLTIEYIREKIQRGYKTHGK